MTFSVRTTHNIEQERNDCDSDDHCGPNRKRDECQPEEERMFPRQRQMPEQIEKVR